MPTAAAPAGSIASDLKFIAKAIVGVLAVLWAIEGVDQLFLGGALDAYGIHPREGLGLLGIFSAPFLHGGVGHLLSNTLGTLAFGTLVLMYGRREFLLVSLAGALVGGLGTWLVGQSGSNHIGFSGVVFAYFGYLLARGWYERKAGSVLLAVGLAWMFGSLLFGAVPGMAGPGISWQGHLFGLLGGIAVARRFKQARSA